MYWYIRIENLPWKQPGKDTIHLQTTGSVKATERKHGSKDYFKFLKKDSDLNWKPVMNAN